MRTILELKINECRWPTGYDEEGHLFCGAGTEDLEPYCEAHAALEFNGGWRRKRKFSAEAVMPAQRREHKDRNAREWAVQRKEHEPDLVEVFDRAAPRAIGSQTTTIDAQIRWRGGFRPTDLPGTGKSFFGPRNLRFKGDGK